MPQRRRYIHGIFMASMDCMWKRGLGGKSA